MSPHLWAYFSIQPISTNLAKNVCTSILASSMENLRKLVRAFNYDPVTKRLYVIRSIFVYASDVELASARALLNPQLVQQEIEKAEQTSAAPVRRGRRRGSAAPVEEQSQSTADSDKERQLKWQEDLARREKNLPFYQRNGYGIVKLAGNEEYRAVIDIEYIELTATN